LRFRWSPFSRQILRWISYEKKQPFLSTPADFRADCLRDWDAFHSLTSTSERRNTGARPECHIAISKENTASEENNTAAKQEHTTSANEWDQQPTAASHPNKSGRN
jgi:hypothetical protein